MEKVHEITKQFWFPCYRGCKINLMVLLETSSLCHFLWYCKRSMVNVSGETDSVTLIHSLLGWYEVPWGEQNCLNELGSRKHRLYHVCFPHLNREGKNSLML